MIQILSPHEMEELLRTLFRFDDQRMPLLVLRGSVVLEDFRIGERRSARKQLSLISQIVAVLRKLSDEQLWTLLVAVKKTDCLDVDTSLGNFFLSIEEAVINILSRRLIARRLAKPNNVAGATHMVLDLFDFWKDDYLSLCLVFDHPTILVEFCCGCSAFGEWKRGKRVLGIV